MMLGTSPPSGIRAAVVAAAFWAGWGPPSGRCRAEDCIDHEETVVLDMTTAQSSGEGVLYGLRAIATTTAPGDPGFTYKWTIGMGTGSFQGPVDGPEAVYLSPDPCDSWIIRVEVDTAGDTCGQGAADQTGLMVDCFPNRIRCDVNGDGRNDLTDAIAILIFLFQDRGHGSWCPEAGDCDGSGRLDVTDAIYDLSFLFLGGAKPWGYYPMCEFFPCDAPRACR